MAVVSQLFGNKNSRCHSTSFGNHCRQRTQLDGGANSIITRSKTIITFAISIVLELHEKNSLDIISIYQISFRLRKASLQT